MYVMIASMARVGSNALFCFTPGTPPPAALKDGVTNPLSAIAKARAWNSRTEEADGDLVKEFKRKHKLRWRFHRLNLRPAETEAND
jgi:hypothetical protein